MAEGEITETVRPTINTIGEDTISRLNAEGLRESWEPLRIVDESREAIYRMPQGKDGIVIASGDNTTEWKQRGWKTLDISPVFRADITVDANFMEADVTPKSQDFILAEHLTFDKYGKEGVQPSRLLQQANRALRNGGYLIIQTANFENVPEANTPRRIDFAGLMTKHGFDTVIEVGNYHHMSDNQKEQKVAYYGRKIAEGYDEGRLAQESENPTFDAQSGSLLK